MKTVIGLMSGTSMDGVDASLIETDGESLIKIKGSLNVPYEKSFKLELIENISNKNISSQTELKLTSSMRMQFQN